MFTDMVGDVLGLGRDRITFHQGDTDHLPGGRGSGGSSSSATGGSSTALAVRAVIEEGAKLAADMLEAAVADIAFADGSFRVTGTDRTVSLPEVAAESERRGTALMGQSQFTPTRSPSPMAAMSARSRSTPRPARSRSAAMPSSRMSAGC